MSFPPPPDRAAFIARTMLVFVLVFPLGATFPLLLVFFLIPGYYLVLGVPAAFAGFLVGWTLSRPLDRWPPARWRKPPLGVAITLLAMVPFLVLFGGRLPGMGMRMLESIVTDPGGAGIVMGALFLLPLWFALTTAITGAVCTAIAMRSATR
jgi:hypothetical protein